MFSLDALDQLTGKITQTYCQPSHDVITNRDEEWVCVFCLQEDSSSLSIPQRDNIFYIDEWGPSSYLPWLLNKRYTNLENIKEGNYCYNCYLITIIIIVIIVTGTIESTIIEGLKVMVDSTTKWSFSDHLRVLLSLCETLKFSPTCIEKVAASSLLSLLLILILKLLLLLIRSTMFKINSMIFLKSSKRI